MRVPVPAPIPAGFLPPTIFTPCVAECDTGQRPVTEGGRVGYSGNVPPFEVDAAIRVTLARVRGSRVTFRIERGGPGGVTLEVANLNNESQPEILDRFSTNDAEATFAVDAARLRDRGPLTIGSVMPRLVLAHYYRGSTVSPGRARFRMLTIR